MGISANTAAPFLDGVAGIGLATIESAGTLAVMRWIGAIHDGSAVVVVADQDTLAIRLSDGRSTVEADLFLRDGAGRDALRRGIRILVHGYADQGRDGLFDIDVHAPTRTAIADVVFPAGRDPETDEKALADLLAVTDSVSLEGRVARLAHAHGIVTVDALAKLEGLERMSIQGRVIEALEDRLGIGHSGSFGARVDMVEGMLGTPVPQAA